MIFVRIQGQNQKPDAVKISTWLYVTGEEAIKYVIPFHFHHVWSIVKPQHCAKEMVRWDQQQPLKEEMAWSWRSPDRGSSSWESQVMHPQHVLGAPPCLLPQPPRGAHASSSSCSWSNLLFCQHKLPNFYLQGCLQPGLQVHWWKQTHFSFYAQMPPCHLSAWDSHGSILLTLHCHRLGLSPDFCLSLPLPQNTTRNPGECQVNTLHYTQVCYHKGVMFKQTFY